MAGRTPHEAFQSFVEPLQQAITCVTDSVLVVLGGGYYPRDEPYALTIGGGPPVRISGPAGTHFGLSVAQQYRLVEDPGVRGPWKVATAAYEYTLLADADGEEILAYHWHPRGRSPVTTPHLHIGPGARVGRDDVRSAHLPTSRISLEEFLRCVIRDFGVLPQRPDWETVLARTQYAFEEWRMWP